MAGADATAVLMSSEVPVVGAGLEPRPERLEQEREELRLEYGPYVARLALTERDREMAYRLRFLVFNLEMQEGLESAYVTGMDTDLFDPVCDHLLVEDRATGAVVGTYRMQMGPVAAKNLGYYSEQEFDFGPYEAMRSGVVELGRACVHRDHRSQEVLHLLWRGVARYALLHGGRWMMGCCSLPTLDVEEGWAVCRSLEGYMVPAELRTRATARYAMPEAKEMGREARAPKLLRAYLTLGAKICGTPAIDRDFKTIDFLTMLDLHTLHPRIAARFLDAR